MDKMPKEKDSLANEQQGVVLIIVAMCLVFFIAFTALAIDMGYLYTTRNELQNVADAAALAGARYLGAQYSMLPLSEMGTHEFTKEEVFAVINETAKNNKAGGKSISIDIDDVEIGFWDPAKSTDDIWSPTLIGPDAVRVIARRDSSANGPISTFFARVININTMNVASRKAVAALSGPSFVEEGGLVTPIGLSERTFPKDCTETIIFHPTADSCASWHNFFDLMSNKNMSDKMFSLIQGDAKTYVDQEDGKELSNGPTWLETNFDIKKTPSPETTPTVSAGQEFYFQGGTNGSLFLGGALDGTYNGNYGTVVGDEKHPAPMPALFDYFRYRDGDGVNSQWTATVPVYKELDPDNCDNPSGDTEILGFAKIVFYTVDPPPLSSLNVHVDCNFTVLDSRGEGITYGNLKGTIPTLVK
jgi:hypothetical protein